jgi:hypothetical protein
MTGRCIFLVVAFLLLTCGIYAQQQVSGRVYSAETDSVIVSASVFNKTNLKLSTTNAYGKYTIAAAEGDTLIFSAVGHASDTMAVEFHMLITQQDITLPQKIISLANVEVFSSYGADSLARRNYYAHIYKKQPGITGFNRPENGAGIVLSPVSFFSREAKQKRMLKKRLIKQEQDAYVDLAFPGPWVSKLTSLTGDSLNLFMYRYRPSYEFCRRTDRSQMVVYISDRLKEFRREN